MIKAAGQGFAADAMDVSGNNIAIGGATYVGTATTVATATSVNGLAQGTIPVTATPNIANGTGGTAATHSRPRRGTRPGWTGTPTGWRGRHRPGGADDPRPRLPATTHHHGTTTRQLAAPRPEWPTITSIMHMWG